MARERRAVPPYLTLGTEDVGLNPEVGWLLDDSAGDSIEVADGSVIPGWDQQRSFRLHRTFCFPSSLPERLGLSCDARLELLIRLRTAKGLFSTIVAREEIAAPEVTVSVSPDSSLLARTVHLECRLVLVRGSSAADALAAVEPGAILWSSRWSARLEGGRARLPLEAVCFSSDPRWRDHSRALLHVDVALDPGVDCEEGICVYLNSDFPSFVSAVESDDPVARALLWEAVIRRCIVASFSLDVGDANDMVEGTLGDQLQRWREGAFPGMSPDAVRSLALDDPSRFEACIQHWVAAASSLYQGPAS